jgi:hypothetical protein
MSGGTGGSARGETTTEELLAAAGITVTEEGRRRARAKLDAARAWYTDEHLSAVHDRLANPPANAA